jgi:hypothetical protein
VKWSVFFKEAFTNFSNYEGAWTSLRTPLPNNALDRKRREYFLGQQQKKPSVQAKRQGIYKSIFFMSQLPNSPFQGGSAVEGEEEVEYDVRPAKRSKQTARGMDSLDIQAQPQMMGQQAPPMPAVAGSAIPMAQQQQQRLTNIAQQQLIAQQQAMLQQQQSGFRRGPALRGLSQYHFHQSILIPHQNAQYDLEPEHQRPKSLMETKQYLLHLLSTEILINTRLHGDFTCSRSEFYSWSPSLPHSTILSVLSFFGLSDKWLGFFRKFLEAPLKFIEDGPSAETRPRKRGVPGAHALSSVCGETILFCMDYAVNQETNGAQLHRMHDDFWIWSSKHETVVRAWAAITGFADTMGVTLNKRKTGTVRILRDHDSAGTINPSILNKEAATSQIPKDQKFIAPIDPSLPVGEIRWGFLVMDPSSGRFIIDQDMVDKHVLELQRQLAEKNKSVFSWIQAWNTYAGTFFKSNFGKPANCFGREHVDMMLSTMTRIQKQIFSDSNVVEYLKSTLQERFGITDIPDGYLYFPTSLGGLELQNPFIGLIQVRDGVFEQPASVLDDFLDAEKEAYRKAQIAFENGFVYRSSNWDENFVPEDSNRFFSFEEFTRYREEFACDYDGNLLSVFEELLEQPGTDDVEFSSDDEVVMGRYRGEVGADGYGRWVAQLYGAEMRERFGGLNVVDKGLLPMGMVTLFRSGRVNWQ